VALDDKTLDPTAFNRQVDRRTPALTILAHHDPAFVSRRAVLFDTIELCRTTPFAALDQPGDSSPLEDPFVSRSPIRLTRDEETVTIDPTQSSTEVQVDGETLTGPLRIETARLERGVVLLLRRRVALLLHTTPALQKRTADEYGLVGTSDQIEQVRRHIRTVAPVDVPVLIRGESGTGKELIASAIHRHSPRGDAQYEAVNMAAIPGTLAASELFGHERGAFTGADRAHKGCFVRADGGTLFMDEVGDTPPEVQTQLLRALETHDIRPVGAPRSIQVDVRLISATDANLEDAIGAGTFRQALLQRLAGYQIPVPPLRERVEDIGALAYHFIRQELETLEQTELLDAPDPRHPWVSAATIARLARHDWPGNVRELRNVVRQLVISGRDQKELAAHSDLERILSSSAAAAKTIDSPPSTVETLPPDDRPSSRPTGSGTRYRDASEVNEDELVSVLREHGYRLAPTAKALGVSRTMLYAMVEKSTRVRKASDLEADEIVQAISQAGGNVAAAAEALEVSTHALKLRLQALGLR